MNVLSIILAIFIAIPGSFGLGTTQTKGDWLVKLASNVEEVEVSELAGISIDAALYATKSGAILGTDEYKAIVELYKAGVLDGKTDINVKDKADISFIFTTGFSAIKTSFSGLFSGLGDTIGNLIPSK